MSLRNSALPTALVALAACLGSATDRPVGARCGSDQECAEASICVYGRCRPPCSFDSDCDEGARCVADGDDPDVRACTLPDEGGCSDESPCPEPLVCREGSCRNECAEDVECGAGRVCIGFCFDDVALVTTWVRPIASEDLEAITDVAADADGAVYITGYTYGALAFDGGSVGGGGATDGFVARYGVDGQESWSLGFGGVEQDAGSAIDLAGDGAILVAGHHGGGFDLGGATFTTTGSTDAFVLRLDASGRVEWADTFGSPDADHALGVAAHDDGVAVAAAVGAPLDFAGGTHAGAGGDDVAVAHLTSAGAEDWLVLAAGADATYADWAHDVAIGPGGEVCATGYYQSTIDFGCGPLQAEGFWTGFLACFDSAGRCLWSERFLSPARVAGYSVAADSQGALYVAGSFQVSADFGEESLVAEDGEEAFVASYSPQGDLRWAEALTGPGQDRAESIAVDGRGVVFLSGHIHDTAHFAGRLLGGPAGEHMVVAAWHRSGAALWAAAYGPASSVQAHGIAVGGEGSVFVVGRFDGDLDIDGEVLDSAGGGDGYLLRLEPVF